jgi:site-specific DNA-methyltransferase (adenine-specific)
MKPYYAEGGMTIYHGDCYEILPTFYSKPELVITDPPYKLSAKGAGIAGRRQYLKDIHKKLDGGFTFDMLDSFENWFCFCAKEQLLDLLHVAQKNRWMLLTWNKPNPTPLVNRNYLPDTEYIVHAFKNSDRLFGEYAERSRYIVWPAEQNEFDHPTVKPLQVMKKLVKLGSQPGDLILDPFVGTGTTMRAAKDLGRLAVGIEIEERYCEIAAKRLSQEVLSFS